MLSMASAIDHLVIAAADPEAAAAELTERVGLAFTAGGRHEGLGTFNRICFLGDAYLELMGVDDPAAAKGWAIGRVAAAALDSGGGFATYGLVDDAIAITVARLQANGSRIGPVVRGSRQRPDGDVVQWWSATPPELGPERPPFLIKHAASGAEWGPDVLAARRAFVHPIGSPARLMGLEISVGDPIGVAATCAGEIGMEFAWVGMAAISTVGRHAVRLVASRDGKVAVTVRIAASVDRPRTVAALGLEFEILPATPG